MQDQQPAAEPGSFLSLIQGTTAIPKAISKLIDTVGDQIGLFLEPTHIRRKGQAQADVTVAEAKAKAEVAVVKLQNKLALRETQDRADERVRKQEAKRQQNIEAITKQAIKELPESVSEKPVDEDWVAQFFNHCQDISNEQMQSIWAKLLAGEVAKPGSFSLRTLALIRVMGKDDANLFTRFCSIVWQTEPGLKGLTPLILDLEKIDSLAGVQLGVTDFVRLDSLGLIRFEANGGFGLKFNSDPRLVWHYYGRQHNLAKVGSREIAFGNSLLTEVGQELAEIAGSSPNEEYRSWVVSTLRRQGWEVIEA